MYIVINSIKNILRYRKRYLISGIFLIVILAVFIFSISNYINMSKEDKELKENYTRWVQFRFRDELQYLGDRSLHSESQGNISEPEKNFVNEVMKQYDYIINVERDYFDQFSEIEYVTDYQLGYIEIVYKDANDYDLYTNELTNETNTKQFALYGGSIDAYERYNNEFFFNGITRYTIIEGEMYENGECLIHKLVSEENDYKIGDELTFYDDDSNELITLKISGIYTVYQTYKDVYNGAFHNISYGEVDLQYRGLVFGSTPYHRTTYQKGLIRQKHVVFTDFDTVYNLYGEESHEFDKYVAWYQLDNIYNFEEFREVASTYNYDKSLGFYQEDNVYKILTRFAPEIATASQIYIIGSIPIIIVILMIVVLLLIRERKREINIMYALGCNKKKIICSLSVEFSLYIFIISLLAIPMSWLIKLIDNFTDLIYGYLESVYSIPIELWFVMPLLLIVLSIVSTVIITIYIMSRKRWSM